MDKRALEDMLAHTPFSAFLGLRLVSAGEGAAELALPARPEFRQEADRLHGGVVAALCDSACVYALLSVDAYGGRFTSTDNRVSYLRPAELGGPELRAAARIVRRGRRIALCEVDVTQAGKLLAKGLSTYISLET